MQTERKKQARFIRAVRKIHRTTGASLFVLFFVVSITGLLLGWKKNSNGLILAKTKKGISTDLKEWLSLDSLHTIALQAAAKQHPTNTPELKRIDVRKNKGTVKFVYDNYCGIQIDGTTGAVLLHEQRNSDLIENIHDGSVVDYLLGTDGWFKLFYTTVMGLALLLFTVTGFWLWYGPKRMRKLNN